MKKEWKKPQLEILDMKQTMGHAKQMRSIDKDFEAGAVLEDLTWS